MGGGGGGETFLSVASLLVHVACATTRVKKKWEREALFCLAEKKMAPMKWNKYCLPSSCDKIDKKDTMQITLGATNKYGHSPLDPHANSMSAITGILYTGTTESAVWHITIQYGETFVGCLCVPSALGFEPRCSPGRVLFGELRVVAQLATRFPLVSKIFVRQDKKKCCQILHIQAAHKKIVSCIPLPFCYPPRSHTPCFSFPMQCTSLVSEKMLSMLDRLSGRWNEQSSQINWHSLLVKQF